MCLNEHHHDDDDDDDDDDDKCISQFKWCPLPPKPPLPAHWGNSGAFICLRVNRGSEHLQFWSLPEGGHLPTPRTTPGHLTFLQFWSRTWQTTSFVRENKDFVAKSLSQEEIEKLVEIFKDMYSQFFITCFCFRYKLHVFVYICWKLCQPIITINRAQISHSKVQRWPKKCSLYYKHNVFNCT